MRRVLAAMMVMAAVLLPATAAYAGYDTPGTVTVDDSTTTPGQTVTISGTNCVPGQTVTISLNGTTLATAVTKDDGTFSATFNVPAGTAPGSYTVDAAGCTTEVLGVTITVGAAAVPAAAALPQTGASNTEPLVRTGVVLIAVGGLVVFAVRKRRLATL